MRKKTDNARETKDCIKVCFVCPKAYPLFDASVTGIFGGAEVDLYTLATELAKDKDFDISFVVADYGQEVLKVIKGVKVIRSLSFAQNPLFGAIKVWRALKGADSDIYFQEAASAGTFLVGLFCRLHKRAFIYRTASRVDCDGTYIREHFQAGRAYRWALRHSKQVIVQNEYDVQDVRKTIGIDSIVIPNAQVLPQLKQGPRDFVLWVGRSTALKRPELFIELTRSNPQEKFVMICPRATDDKNYEELQKKASETENLEFIPRVSFFEIDSYFSQAKMFVCTSSGEGFPNTYIQACKYAVPILSLKVNPDGFLDNYSCGRCAEDNWEKFLENFQVLAQSSIIEQYGRNARLYAEHNHDIVKIARVYRDLFCDIMDDKRK